MIIVMKPDVKKEKIEELRTKLNERGIIVNLWEGQRYSVLGLLGDTSLINPSQIESDECVDRVLHVQESYKKSNRLFHPDDTVIKVGDEKIGSSKIAIMAGPCSVESEEQLVGIAEALKKSGAGFLRGGAFKPRTSPYSFQGMEEKGLDILKKAREITGLPIVTEIMSTKLVEKFVEDVDIIQVGARNMQNFDLLKELGKTKKTILLKRGLSATVEELLMSAEYIMAGGNDNVVLCERGIRTFETYTRNTLDLSAVPVIKKLSHLPIVIDPSHAGGMWWLVEPLAKAAVAVGADGLMIEVHNDPVNAKSDGSQSLKPEKFDSLMKSLRGVAKAVGKEI